MRFGEAAPGGGTVMTCAWSGAPSPAIDARTKMPSAAAAAERECAVMSRICVVELRAVTRLLLSCVTALSPAFDACAERAPMAPRRAIGPALSGARAAPERRVAELRYDTLGAGAGGGIEISGSAETDLTRWSVVLERAMLPACERSESPRARYGRRGVSRRRQAHAGALVRPERGQ